MDLDHYPLLLKVCKLFASTRTTYQSTSATHLPWVLFVIAGVVLLMRQLQGAFLETFIQNCT